jgi:hypothetical protein
MNLIARDCNIKFSGLWLQNGHCEAGEGQLVFS